MHLPKGCLTEAEPWSTASHHTDLKPSGKGWDKLDLRLRKRKPTSAQHMWELQLKTVGKAPCENLTKLAERIKKRA